MATKVNGRSRSSKAQKANTASASEDAAPEVLVPRKKDQFGYTEGTDSSITANLLLEGGVNRQEVSEKIRAAIEAESGLVTRNGTEKNIPNLVATILRQLRIRGYVVESHWRVIPGEHVVTVEGPAVVASDPSKSGVAEFKPRTRKAKVEDAEPAEQEDETPAPKKTRRVRKTKK